MIPVIKGHAKTAPASHDMILRRRRFMLDFREEHRILTLKPTSFPGYPVEGDKTSRRIH